MGQLMMWSDRALKSDPAHANPGTSSLQLPAANLCIVRSGTKKTSSRLHASCKKVHKAGVAQPRYINCILSRDEIKVRLEVVDKLRLH